MKSVYFALLFEATSSYYGQGGYGEYSGGEGFGSGYGYSRSRGSGPGGDPFNFGGYGEYGYGGNGGGNFVGDYDYGYNSGGYGGYVGQGYGGFGYGGFGYGPQMPRMPPQMPPFGPMIPDCYGKQFGAACNGPYGTPGFCSAELKCIPSSIQTGNGCLQDTDCGSGHVCTNNECELGELSLERPEGLPDFRKTDIFHRNPEGGDLAWRNKNELKDLDSDDDDDAAILDLIHYSGSFRTYLKDHEKMAELINESEEMREIIEDLVEDLDDSKFAKICEKESFPKSSQDTSSRYKATTFKDAALDWYEKLDDDWDLPREHLKKGKCPEGLNTNLYNEKQNSNCDSDNWTGKAPDTWVPYSKKLDNYHQQKYVEALQAAKDRLFVEREDMRKAIDALFKKTSGPSWVSAGGVYTTLGKGEETETDAQLPAKWIDTTGGGTTIKAPTAAELYGLAKAYWKLLDTETKSDPTEDKFNITQMITEKDTTYDDGTMQTDIRELNVYGGCDDPDKDPPYLLDEWRTFECDNNKAKFLRTFEDPEVLREIRGLVQAVLSAKSNMKESVLGLPVLDDPTGETNFESNSMVRSIHNQYERKLYEVSETTAPPRTTQPPTTGVPVWAQIRYNQQSWNGAPPNVGGYSAQIGYGQQIGSGQGGDQYFNGPNHHYYQ